MLFKSQGGNNEWRLNKRALKKAIVLGLIIVVILSVTNAFGISGTMPESGIEIKIEKEWKGYHCGYTEPLRVVIYTENQWEEIWKKVQVLRLPVPELPKIDFEKEMIIAVFMGTRSSGGYEIEIKNISKTEKEIVVGVEEKEPSPDSLRTMALTSPYHVVIVKRSSLPVRFQSL